MSCDIKQPNWECLANFGDCSFLEHGGAFVYSDLTGVYAPELEILEVHEGELELVNQLEFELGNDSPSGFQMDRMEKERDSIEPYTVYRVFCDRCTYIDGILSDNRFYPKHPAWFADKLELAASSCGMDVTQLRHRLCSSDPIELAKGYHVLIRNFGAYEFDQYPITLNRVEAEKRYTVELTKRF